MKETEISVKPILCKKGFFRWLYEIEVSMNSWWSYSFFQLDEEPCPPPPLSTLETYMKQNWGRGKDCTALNEDALAVYCSLLLFFVTISSEPRIGRKQCKACFSLSHNFSAFQDVSKRHIHLLYLSVTAKQCSSLCFLREILVTCVWIRPNKYFYLMSLYIEYSTSIFSAQSKSSCLFSDIWILSNMTCWLIGSEKAFFWIHMGFIPETDEI